MSVSERLGWLFFGRWLRFLRGWTNTKGDGKTVVSTGHLRIFDA